MAINRFVIHWRSKVNGRVGRGSKQFTEEEATRLVEELNNEYPDIEHSMAQTTEDEAPPRNIVDLSRGVDEAQSTEEAAASSSVPSKHESAEEEPKPAPGSIISTAE